MDIFKSKKFLYFYILLGIIFILSLSVNGIIVKGVAWDFLNFYDAGHKILVGQISDLYNPQALIAGEKALGEMPFRGAPISGYLYSPLALLGPDAALYAFKIQNVIFLWIALFFLYQHMRRYLDKSPNSELKYAALFVLLAAAFQPFWTTLYVGGQSTALVLLLLVLSLRFHTASRFILSALCFASAIVIKPGFSTGLLFVALVSDRRFLVAAITIGASLGILSLLTMGWDIQAEYLRIIIDEANKVYWPGWNSGIFGFVDWLFIPADAQSYGDRPTEAARWILGLRLCIVAVFVFLCFDLAKAQTTTAGRQHHYIILGIIFSLSVMPVVWAHYLSMLFLLIAYVVATRRFFSMSALWTIWLMVAFAACQHLSIIRWVIWNIVDVNSTLHLVLLQGFKSIPLLLALVFLVRHRKELYASYAST